MSVERNFEPFGNKEINKMTNREAMALPSFYQEESLDQKKLKDSNLKLRSLSPSILATIIESEERNFYDRLAAGTLLATLGDPRINCYNPSMISIPGDKNVTIGLSQNEVDSVYQRYKKLGVLKEWILKETPEINITMPSFKLAKYPVTNLEFREFLIETKFLELPSSWEFGSFPHSKSNCPVYTISAKAADSYCLWLSHKTGRKFRLPTEFEWEYAAAGPFQFEFPWGNTFESHLANTNETGLFQSSPVGLFPQGKSFFGHMDMAGNVEEYVSNDYFPYGEEIIQDDLSLALGTYRIARGGSFTRFEDLARCKRRHGRYPSPLYVMGFRLAEEETL